MTTAVKVIEHGGHDVEARLTLDITPEATLTGGKIAAAVKLAFEHPSRPIRERDLRFVVDGAEKGMGRTNDDGNKREVFDVDFGAHDVMVEVVGTGLFVIERHTFPRPSAKKLARPPRPTVEGNDGDYMIFFSGLKNEDETFAGGITVRFTVSPLGEATKADDYSTDRQGFVGCRLRFPAAECDVSVGVPGFDPFELENLYGPPTTPRPLERSKLKPTPAELEGDWWNLWDLWALIKRGWHKPKAVRDVLAAMMPRETTLEKLERRST